MPQHRRRSDGRQPARKRRARRNIRAFLFITVIAAVVISLGSRYLISHYAPQADPLALAAGQIQRSHAALELEHQRQTMILMAVATKSFKVVGKPKVATVPTTATASSSGGGGGGSAPTVSAPIPSPGTAESIARQMLPSFGFSTSQYGCLYQMWMRESGWSVTAANASGAYGIPQALPGSKMASAGPNWQTSATTQIKWGLGYIKQRYGTPCGAWAFWQSNGWY